MAGNRSLGSLVINLIAKVAGFEQGMDKAARAAADRSKKIAKSIAAIGATAAAVTGAITAASVSWTRDVINMGAELEKLSKISKASTQEFQRWAVGAQTVGISQEKLSDQLKDFNEKVGEFQQTGGGGMRDFFEQIAPKIGITAEAFRNLSGPQALQLYFDSLEKANLSQEQLSFYLESMASDTTALIPLLKNGGEGFRRWGNEAERLGAILDSDTLKAINAVREQTARLDQIMLGLKVTIAKELLPPFERFSSLLGEKKTQDGLRTMASLLGDTAAAAVTFAEKIAQAGNAYRQWLADAGRLPANMLDNEEQIKERIRKLSRIIHAGNDPLNQVRMALFGDDFRAQLRAAEQELKRFPFRNVMSGASSMPVGGAQPTGGGNPPGGGGGRDRQLPNFAKDAAAELREMMEAMADARGEFDAWAAQLAGPVAEANYRFAVDMERLNELARKGEVAAEDLAEAQGNLRAKHEANLKALQAQLTPAQEALRLLEGETAWLRANAEGQRELAAARLLGADATAEQIAQAVESMRVNEELAESIRSMDAMRGEFSDFFTDTITGAKSVSDAFKDMADNIAGIITRMIADQWVEQLFGGFGTSGAGSAGGGWLSALAGMFGGGKANGGWASANTMFEVNERGLEMATVKGRDYLLTGNSPVHITPNHRLGGAGQFQQQVNFNVQGKIDMRTQSQIASEMWRQGRKSAARLGA